MILILSACQNPLLKAVKDEVAFAKAIQNTLTIQKPLHASTEPSGSVQVHEGFSVNIKSIPDNGFNFVNWVKSSGSGTVKFGDATKAETSVSLSGGSATISAIVISQSAPTINTFSVSTGITHNNVQYVKTASINLNISATDSDGIGGYFIAETTDGSIPPEPTSDSAWLETLPSSYTLTSPQGPISLYLWVEDTLEKVSAYKKVSLVLDSTPPTVASTSPSGATASVISQTSISVTFSEDVDSSTLGNSISNSSAIRFKDTTTGGPGISTSLSYSSATKTATISLAGWPLTIGDSYKIEVYNTLKDLAGNSFAGNPSAYTFTATETATITYKGQFSAPSPSTFPSLNYMLLGGNTAGSGNGDTLYVNTNNGNSLNYGEIYNVNISDRSSMTSVANHDLRSGPGMMAFLSTDANNLYVAHSGSGIRKVGLSSLVDNGDEAANFQGALMTAGDPGWLVRIRTNGSTPNSIVGYTALDVSGDTDKSISLDDIVSIVTVNGITYALVQVVDMSTSSSIEYQSTDGVTLYNHGTGGPYPGGTAYDLTGNGDVNDPDVATSMAYDGAPSIGNVLVVGNTGSQGIGVYFLDDGPDSLSLYGSASVPGVQDVASLNGFVVAAQGTNGLAVVDIRDANRPYALQKSKTLSGLGATAGQALKVTMQRVSSTNDYDFYVYVMASTSIGSTARSRIICFEIKIQ